MAYIYDNGKFTEYEIRNREEAASPMRVLQIVPSICRGDVINGQQTSSDGSVRFQPNGADDRETITVDTARIDPRIRKIVFVLTIDEALTQKLHFGMLQNVYLRILDDRDGREILSYPLENAFENVTSMTLGELYLHQGQWKFNPVGNGVHMDLAGQCALYGVTLA